MIGGTLTGIKSGCASRVSDPIAPLRPARNLPTILKQLGLPKRSAWEEAAPRIKRKIVFCRRNNLEELAALWSEVKERLKRRLPRKCMDCEATTSKGAYLRCASCENKHRKGVPRTREYRALRSAHGLTQLAEQFARAAERPFFLQEIWYWVHLQKPELEPRQLKQPVKYALLQMCRRGMLQRDPVWKRFTPQKPLGSAG
jgi:hypothetical protein